MESTTTKIDSPAIDYAHAVDEILHFYTRIDKTAATMPPASMTPFLNVFWKSIIFVIAFYADILLILPINIVVFFRNIFPGRWAYRCFSCRYFKIVARWVWIGEFIPPAFIFRPIVISLLHWHFRNRLSKLRKQILVETRFSEDQVKASLDKIDRAMVVWEQRTTVKSVVFSWLLPLIGPATYVWNWFVPASFMPTSTWTHFAVSISVSYALGFLSAAFVVKRGLMLGGTGSAAFYPGFALGSGGYAQEKQI